MRWEGNRESDNVEDRRRGGGLGGLVGGGRRGVGIGTIVIALLGGWALGINPLTILGFLGGGDIGALVQPGGGQSTGPAQRPPADDKAAKFVSVVLADTEDVWREQFRQLGKSYQLPELVLFRGSTPTACGQGQAAAGPFYCPADQKVYIDLGFFDLLRERFKAPGEFAQAYVIAHEVGHHVQNLLGISGKVDAMRGRISEAQQNALSVRLELQADCFAGVWAAKANEARKILESGDVEAALRAASAIGDDTLQRQARGTVVPESFTHGSSEQRARWFSQGLKTGDLRQCDTFAARQL